MLLRLIGLRFMAKLKIRRRRVGKRSLRGPKIGFLLPGMLLLALSGCTQLGPDLVKAGRIEYNQAIQQTTAREMLLNIVRARYGDGPLFLDVSSVSTSFDWRQEITATGAFGLDAGSADSAGIGANLGYTEQPTITYTPQGGVDFVKNMLTPMDLDTLIFLSNAGWSIDRLLRLMANRMGGLPNAPTASGPTPGEAPAYEAFRRAAKSMRLLQKAGMLAFGYAQKDGGEVPILRIAAEASDWEETIRLKAMLKLDPKKNDYLLDGQGARSRPDVVGIELRSLVGAFFFLSHGVDVPARDKNAGRVMLTRDGEGRPFDWDVVIGDLFKVYSQSDAPGDARISVGYRDAWFYLDDSDLASKYTFLLMGQLSALLAGKIQKAVPTLTLPVYR